MTKAILSFFIKTFLFGFKIFIVLFFFVVLFFLFSGYVNSDILNKSRIIASIKENFCDCNNWIQSDGRNDGRQEHREAQQIFSDFKTMKHMKPQGKKKIHNENKNANLLFFQQEDLKKKLESFRSLYFEKEEIMKNGIGGLFYESIATNNQNNSLIFTNNVFVEMHSLTKIDSIIEPSYYCFFDDQHKCDIWGTKKVKTIGSPRKFWKKNEKLLAEICTEKKLSKSEKKKILEMKHKISAKKYRLFNLPILPIFQKIQSLFLEKQERWDSLEKKRIIFELRSFCWSDNSYSNFLGFLNRRNSKAIKCFIDSHFYKTSFNCKVTEKQIKCTSPSIKLMNFIDYNLTKSNLETNERKQDIITFSCDIDINQIDIEKKFILSVKDKKKYMHDFILNI